MSVMPRPSTRLRVTSRSTSAQWISSSTQQVRAVPCSLYYAQLLAGITSSQLLVRTTPKSMEDIFRTNVFGTVQTEQQSSLLTPALDARHESNSSYHDEAAVGEYR